MPVLLTSTNSGNGQNNSDDSPNGGVIQDSMGYSLQNFKEELLDLPLYEAYDSNGDPRHVYTPKKDRNMTIEEIKTYLREFVLKQWCVLACIGPQEMWKYSVCEDFHLQVGEFL